MTVLADSRLRKCRTRQQYSFFSHRERSELSRVSESEKNKAFATATITGALPSARSNNLHPMSSPLGGYDVTELSRHCMALVANPVDQVRVAMMAERAYMQRGMPAEHAGVDHVSCVLESVLVFRSCTLLTAIL